MRPLILIGFSVSYFLSQSALAEDLPRDTIDGFKITPALFTVNNADQTKTDASKTLGLEYKFDHTFGKNEGEDYKGWNGTIAGEGKFAFDQKQNVGDLLDFSLHANYRNRWLPTVDPYNNPVKSYGYLTAGLKLGFQTDQSFTNKQTLVGIETKAFYALTATPEFATNLWPAITLGYERVKPNGDDTRKKIDPNLDMFNRLHARLSSSIGLGTISGGRNVKLEFKIDHWREISPSSQIKLAELDRQTYRAFCLRESTKGDDTGWSITYSSGKVPTDKKDAKVWQLGYSMSGKFL